MISNVFGASPSAHEQLASSAVVDLTSFMPKVWIRTFSEGKCWRHTNDSDFIINCCKGDPITASYASFSQYRANFRLAEKLTTPVEF